MLILFLYKLKSIKSCSNLTYSSEIKIIFYHYNKLKRERID